MLNMHYNSSFELVPHLILMIPMGEEFWTPSVDKGTEALEDAPSNCTVIA